MDERKKAYELLGLPEGASKEEVENRYFLLIRRERASRQRVEAEQIDEQPFNPEEINKAYKTILEYDEKKTMARYDAATYGKFKGMAGFAQKVDHFFNYYKLHMFVVIGLILAITFATMGFIDHRHKAAELAKLPPIDVSVSFFGDFTSMDGNKLDIDLKPTEADILSNFPQWKRVQVFFTYLNMEMDKQGDSEFLQRSTIDLAMNQPDVYIFDKASFARLASVGALLPLDGANASKLGPGLKPELELKSKTVEDPEEHVYGVDISASPLLEGLPLVGNAYIAGISAFPDRLDNAFMFVKKYLD
ncbi:J domain-containing protein [Paenibacillus lycopersici]|uniref:J domain-containing protein n=1 Tax=Paenibacillus lycopersici TaxID=2704462 RepID=A0A6C0G416_9BACL|nr:J domain-containing protein [Paenibacillus lycopersici]QHT62551.1 J domain-containing protein [Paenibacillus lycopersici]